MIGWSVLTKQPSESECFHPCIWPSNLPRQVTLHCQMTELTPEYKSWEQWFLVDVWQPNYTAGSSWVEVALTDDLWPVTSDWWLILKLTMHNMHAFWIIWTCYNMHVHIMNLCITISCNVSQKFQSPLGSYWVACFETLNWNLLL